jgi:two-component sensor histidine kinase
MFSKLLNRGVTDQLDLYQKRETRALNLFAIITVIGSLVGTVNVYLIGDAYPTFIVIIQALASFLIFYFNHKGSYNLSAYLFVITMNLTLLYINLFYSSSTGSYLYYFPLVFCIALLHNPNKSQARDLVFFSLILFSFACSRFLILPFIGSAGLSETQNKIVFDFNLKLVIVLTIILVYLLIGLINKQYSELTDLLKITKDDQLTIKNSLKEKEVLLAEIQHRVKNNLSVIIGLFNLQKSNASSEEARQAINEAKNRVLSIAMVHERLYKKQDLSHINLKHYVSELAKEVVRSHPLHNKVSIIEELENIDVDITKAVPIGLVVNEIITNSLKHAFTKAGVQPSIRIILTSHFGQISVKIQDNGIGFHEHEVRNDRSLGLTLIESLAEQIDGNIHYTNSQGASVKLSFPV